MSRDYVSKDDGDAEPHQPLPHRREVRHGATAAPRQRARVQDRDALLPAVRAGARHRQGVCRAPREGLPPPVRITVNRSMGF